MSEILVIVAIGLAIFMLPRLLGKPDAQNAASPRKMLDISGWLRLAILASMLWPAGWALYLKPWNGHWLLFLSLGMGPVIFFWGVFWVLSGFRK